MKRFFDLIVSILGLIVLWPVFLVIAIIIKFESKGPIFFKQQRVGKGGVLFKIKKFRTMTFSMDADSGSFDLGDSSRITTFGKFLRKTKLDELPQLINVLVGEMSIVGPRPEVKKWVDVYKEKFEIVLNVKPGITDNASIVFRNEEYILANSKDPYKTYKDVILPKKIELYKDYVENQSLLKDFAIIIKTIKTVIIK